MNAKEKQGAIALLRSIFSNDPALAEAICTAHSINKYGWPDTFSQQRKNKSSWHFNRREGKKLRQTLITHGFTAKSLGVYNLEDIYIRLIEEALNLRTEIPQDAASETKP